MSDRARGTLTILLPVILFVVIRGLFLSANWDSPFFDVPVVDAKDFHDKAVLIASGEDLPARPYARPPLYTYFVAFLFRLFGPEMRVVILAQQLLGFATVAMATILATRLFGRVAGVIAGGLLALSRLPLVIEGQLLNETVQTFLLVACVLVFVDAIRRGCRARVAGSTRRGAVGLLIVGAVLGACAILTRPTSALFVVPALAVVVMMREGGGLAPRHRRRLFGPGAVAAALLCFVGVAGSAAVRNRVVGEEWVAVSYNGGINFFIGNAARSDELINIRPGYRWDRLVQTPRALGELGVHQIDPWRDGFASWDRRYYQAAVDDMLTDPVGAIARLARKSVQFWSWREIDRNLAPAAFVASGSPLARVTLPFAVLGPLAFAGVLLLAWRRPPGWRAIMGLIFATWVTGIIFFVTSRYRIPAYPAMAIAAGYLITAMGSGLRGAMSSANRGERSHVTPGALPAGSVVVPVIALALAAAVAFTDAGGAARIAPARESFLRAVVLERSGDAQGALAAYRVALTDYPNDPDVLMGPIVILMNSGRAEEAAELAGRAARLLPDVPAPRFNLGLALSQLGRHEDAAAAFERLIEIQPSSARAYYQFGRSLVDAGRPEAALAPLARAAEMAPRMPLPLVERARALVRLERGVEARDAVEKAKQLDPGIIGMLRQYPELTELR